jgi:hypothetical protein
MLPRSYTYLHVQWYVSFSGLNIAFWFILMTQCAQGSLRTNMVVCEEGVLRWLVIIIYSIIGTVSRDFLLQVFLHESSSPKLLKITLGSFQKICSKILRNIRKSRFATVSTTSAANNGNIIRLLTHKSKLEGKNFYLYVNSTFLKGVQTK